MNKKLPKKQKSSSAQNRLRSEGAEFLVLANLLIRDIQATKAYTNFPGWDVLAVNPKTGKQARVQVKSRWATDSGNFLVQNFECDFVVLVYLNRGFNFSKRGRDENGIKDPQFWIFPTTYLLQFSKRGKSSGKFGKSISFRKNKMPGGGADFESKWEQISIFLSKE
jgi:hypothetical protein